MIKITLQLHTLWYGSKYSGSSNNRCEGSGGHPGVDIRGVSQLSKIVRSIGKGTVIEKNYSSGFGNYLIIQHDDRDYGKFYSVYGHLKSGSLDNLNHYRLEAGRLKSWLEAGKHSKECSSL